MGSIVFQVNFVIYYITVNAYMNSIHYKERSFKSMTFLSVLSFSVLIWPLKQKKILLEGCICKFKPKIQETCNIHLTN